MSEKDIRSVIHALGVEGRYRDASLVIINHCNEHFMHNPDEWRYRYSWLHGYLEGVMDTIEDKNHD